MSNTVTATDLKNKVADVLNNVIYTGSETIVLRHGKPVAKIVPVSKDANTAKAIDIKKAINATFGSLPDFPDKEKSKTKDLFLEAAGSWKDIDADKMIKGIYKARRDGSRKKKFLGNWE